MNRFYEVKGKYVIVFTVIFALFMVIVLPYISELSERLTSSFGSPDLNFKFDIAYLNEIRMSYGTEGRRNYIILRWTFDVIWPIVYTLFYMSVIGFFSRKTESTIKWLYIPLLALIFDFIENILATIYMGFFPEDLYLIAYLLMGASMIKWMYVSLSFIAIFYLIFKYMYQKIKRPI